MAAKSLSSTVDRRMHMCVRARVAVRVSTLYVRLISHSLSRNCSSSHCSMMCEHHILHGILADDGCVANSDDDGNDGILRWLWSCAAD